MSRLFQNLDEQVQGDFYTCNFEKDAQPGNVILNLGPQHPSTHGVLRIIAELDGEYMVRSEPVLGYLHRMQEKMAETRGPAQFMPNTGRLDYLNSMAWNWAYAGAVERLAGIAVSARAEYIRVIVAELSRIASHLVWLGAFLLDLGAFTPILYTFDDREDVLDILQMVSGSRLTYSYFRFGGVAADITPEFAKRTNDFISLIRERLPMYHKLVTGNMIFQGRTKDRGIVDQDMCRRYGATGPVARGSGISHDLRRAEPYSVYDQFAFEIPVRETGCCFARYEVRMEELAQSLSIVEQALEGLPEGPILGEKAPKFTMVKLPAGEASFAVEAAKGVAKVWLVSDGGKNPYRIKLRSPSFSNLSTFSEVTEGMLMTDALTYLGSLDLVIPELDR